MVVELIAVCPADFGLVEVVLVHLPLLRLDAGEELLDLAIDPLRRAHRDLPLLLHLLALVVLLVQLDDVAHFGCLGLVVQLDGALLGLVGDAEEDPAHNDGHVPTGKHCQDVAEQLEVMHREHLVLYLLHLRTPHVLQDVAQLRLQTELAHTLLNST